MEVPSYQTLLDKFEMTKKELGETEENIKRITGRDPDTFANGVGGPNKWKNQQVMVQNRNFQGRKRPLFPIGKPKEETEKLEEESPEEEEHPNKKPSLQSTVVATPKDKKSRRDSIQEQNVNSKVKARNRRMLGMILGTLQKFQHEAKSTKEKDLKRAEIEQKVEAAAAEEKEKIKKEKEELFHARKEKQIQLRCLEKKLEIAELHETWEKSQKNLIHFIKTDTKPHVFFLPAKHSEKSEKRLEESKSQVLALLKEQKEKMEKELLEVEEWYRKDDFPTDKENIGPLEESEPQEEPMPEPMPDPEPEPESNTEATAPESEMTEVTPEERTNEKNLDNLADQEFEPIYD